MDNWYLSPLKDERTPSFKINRRLNRWFDHGLGRGRSRVDFAMLFHKCSLSEVLQKFDNNLSFQQHPIEQQEDQNQERSIRILETKDITSIGLVRYLSSRGISFSLANQFCTEVRYSLCGKIYYGIGFKNDSAGYEIRNPYFKGSCSPKDITTLDFGSKTADVFEGFSDFLSYLAIHLNHSQTQTIFWILNSVSFFENARSFMEKHDVIRLYLDRDQAGQNCSQHALSINKKYTDESHFYKTYKDLNEWLVNRGKFQVENSRTV